MKEKLARPLLFFFACAILLSVGGCDRNPLSGSQLTRANYDKISVGMSKAQVEHILGRPTTVETKDMIIFNKATYRYEDGKNFAIVTFKNDEVDGKDTNLGR